jgi:hypothetical protein
MNMSGEVSFYSVENTEVRKDMPVQELGNVVKQMEAQSGWKIKNMIKSIIKREADDFSISKNEPSCRLLITNCINDISIRFRKEKKEIRVMIPKDGINTL